MTVSPSSPAASGQTRPVSAPSSNTGTGSSQRGAAGSGATGCPRDAPALAGGSSPSDRHPADTISNEQNKSFPRPMLSILITVGALVDVDAPSTPAPPRVARRRLWSHARRERAHHARRNRSATGDR